MTLNILVSMSRGGWICNRVCPAVIARWSVENVWYNAVIERVLPDTVWVMFTDYGNSDEVEMAFVLTNLSIGALVNEYL